MCMPRPQAARQQGVRSPAPRPLPHRPFPEPGASVGPRDELLADIEVLAGCAAAGSVTKKVPASEPGRRWYVMPARTGMGRAGRALLRKSLRVYALWPASGGGRDRSTEI